MGVTTAQTLLLGWDVGGWHGRKDGVAALRHLPDGQLDPAGQPSTCGFGELIARGTINLAALAEQAGVANLLASAERVVVGIDAPLGLPREFVRAVNAPITRVPVLGRTLSGKMDNPLAYRVTDRFVFERSGKSPLSASFDILANNTSKARAACAQLRASDDRVRIIPFEDDDGAVAVIEVYPALWRVIGGRAAALAEQVVERCAGSNDDERDACLCALTAGCYEATRTGRAGNELPAVALPAPELSQIVREEGWIYAPIAPE